jgi:undecaprenyl diphosphate synthase
MTYVERLGMDLKEEIPAHIAIIMDGNGRWAEKRHLPRVAGHRAGVKSVRQVVEKCREIGVKVLTLYAFSIDNWRRPRQEVNRLMEYLVEFLIKERPTMIKDGIRFEAIGRIEELPEAVKKELHLTREATQQGKDMILNLALNYGGRAEIVDAARKLSEEVQAQRLQPDEITEERFKDYLYTAGLPDPDLLIRTSGEQRISNFLLWQTSYTEWYVTDILWPDFGKEELCCAIEVFRSRQRRFGGVST